MSDLAVTARCMADLSVLQDEVAEHILDVFVARRGADPESGETMHGVGGPLRKLHADLSGGRSIRALTWYDRGRDVCWLLAAGDHTVYDRVTALARTGAHLPTTQDIAEFEADAPIRLIERVVRQARPALEGACAAHGAEVPLTGTPPPRAYFRVEDDRLWVRIVIFEQGRRQLNERQVGVIWAGVFGSAQVTIGFPSEGGSWDSIYLVGPCPSPDDFPPPRRLDPI